eukprot:210449_1
MAVLHTGGRQRCNLDVKGIGLRNFFHICVNATALMNLRRPYTDMFIESMNRMKAHPNQTLFICSSELAAMDALSADVTPILISPTSRQSSFIGRYFSISSEVSGCTEHLQSMLLDHLRTLDTPHECQTFRVGDSVLPVYTHDGRLHEAVVTQCMDNGRVYRVRYVGYENEENVGKHRVFR